MNAENSPADPFDLARFVQAQAECYDRALAEIRRGRKSSHWMWYIFPQIAGLGFSAMSQRYSIKSAAEAEAYLNHVLLGTRLVECCEGTLAVEGRTALQIFGAPDDMKLKSCATLFETVAPDNTVFGRLLEKYYGGERDGAILRLLRSTRSA